ncbi:aminotransferase class V-fold PLP-dependent enzyme [Roseivirga spongicola]|uniref:aminotransferase class V-fold PLP-dependent enzyme n=1 Tax=Roseivirga spongicola TaxID=333140 RepID=UPI002AC9EED3|nr:aminotransferase class V-fold PLP-dependent enzyme [Roseivirga spongicola]WPZ11072.1 aminotransferase class V-fold PLP-dependent enzyme [Roseivirga spongicola]
MLNNQKDLFNLPDDITYLNCSYMSPMLKSVAEVGVRALYGKEDPTSVKPEDFFKNTSALRAEFAKLINAKSGNDCAIVPSVSYALANVAKNLKAGHGDNIVIADEQFPSNVYAWKELEREKGIELKYVSAPNTREGRGKLWNERILETIDSNTKMVATGHVHWADGTKFNLSAIRERADEMGAILVIDGTQSIGALPFDVQKFRPDAVVASGYKWLMGPYSSGVAYFGEYFRDGRPIENNWMNRLNSEDFRNLINYQDDYQPGAIRYEVGESANFILTPMLTRAIQQINEWQPENIQAYCKNLTAPFLNELQNIGIAVEDEAYRAEHLLGLRLPDHMVMEDVKKRFDAERIYVSIRGNSIRVSPHLYNGEADLQRLIECFKVNTPA